MQYFAVRGFFVFLIVILSLTSFSEAAIGRADASHPAHPGKCVIDKNTILSPGQQAKAPNHPCASVKCLDNGQVVLKTCAAEAPPKGCKLRDFVNTDRAFPDCCERKYECKKF